jgi:hypothetical protein
VCVCVTTNHADHIRYSGAVDCIHGEGRKETTIHGGGGRHRGRGGGRSTAFRVVFRVRCCKLVRSTRTSHIEQTQHNKPGAGQKDQKVNGVNMHTATGLGHRPLRSSTAQHKQRQRSNHNWDANSRLLEEGRANSKRDANKQQHHILKRRTEGRGGESGGTGANARCTDHTHTTRRAEQSRTWTKQRVDTAQT